MSLGPVFCERLIVGVCNGMDKIKLISPKLGTHLGRCSILVDEEEANQ